MFSYEKFYDHFVITQNNKPILHVDTESEAKKIVFELKSENVDADIETVKHYGKNYVTYHLHTEDSLLDSCTNYKLYIDKAVELGQKAICFTEHGNIFNWVEKKLYCDEKGIKYIHGIECYLTETLDEKIRDNYHTILIAKNEDGFKELNNLVFLSNQKDHFYYKPRLTFDEFLGISDNVIKISACVQSPLNQYKGKRLHELLQHYDYYEIQYHNFDKQIEFNKFLYQMSLKYNKPLIVGTDTHSLDNYKAECRMILMLSKGITYSYEENCDLTYQSYDSLVKKFIEQNSLPMDVVLQAIDNTNIMADSVYDMVLDKKVKYPYLYPNDEEVLWDKLKKNFKEKYNKGILDKSQKQKYIDNIKEEMRVFKKTDMIGFMLFMSELVSDNKANGIKFGYARGSCSGSTVAYISDIIDVDPVKHHTIFSRFANEYRKEIGDIDIDVYDDQRQTVYDYIINRFGVEHTAYILSMGTLADKGCIDDIGRALAIKWRLDNGLSKDDKRYDNENPYNLTKVAEIKELYDNSKEQARKQYSELFYYFDGLLGCAISQSQHPAGIICCYPSPLVENYGMFLGDDGQRILPINMEEVHEIGLVKYDILGLRNVGIIRDACQYANIEYPKSYQINFNDQNVYADMVSNPIGVFQFEGDYAFNTLKQYYHNIKSQGMDFTLDDVTICNAAIRPSGASYRDDLIALKEHKNPSELIDKLLEHNHGYLVYQEDIIAFLQQICGLSGGEADNVRRAIGRKQKDRLDAAMPSILEGYCNKSDKDRNIAEEEAKEFLRIIEDASSYMFGFNHATGYSMITYTCAYLRYYYPLEFICAFLNCSKSDEDILNGTKLAIFKGVKIVSPKFRYSSNDYTINKDDNIIYKGLSSIKDVGKDVGGALYTLKDNHYNNFIELLKDIVSLKDNNNKRIVNSKVLNILIHIDFFSEFGTVNELLYLRDLYMQFGAAKILSVPKLDLDTLEIAKKYAQNVTEKQLRGIDNLGLINALYEANKHKIKPISNLDHIKYETIYLGYTDKEYPCKDNRYYVVLKTDTNKYGTPILTVQRLNDKTKQGVFKVDYKWWDEYKCEQGDIIHIAFKKKSKKRLNENGKWYDTGEFEYIIKYFAKVEEIS